MEIINDELNSTSLGALANINKLNRKGKSSRQVDEQQQQQQRPEADAEAANKDITRAMRLYGFQTPINRQPGRMPASAPFGCDSSFSYQPRPPPIGFRTDLIAAASSGQIAPTRGPSPAGDVATQKGQWQQPRGGGGGGGGQDPLGRSESDQALYSGDAWSRIWFQRVMVLSLIRLLVFVRKIYEDLQATKQYNEHSQWGHFLAAAGALFLPTFIFTTYRVCRYLQFALPPIRAVKLFPTNTHDNADNRDPKQTLALSGPTNTQRQGNNTHDMASRSSDDSQATRALMESRASGSITPRQQADEEGLVTARQTPTNLDEFHDSKSQQAISVAGTSSPAPSTAIVKDSPPQFGGQRPTGEQATGERSGPNSGSIGESGDREVTRVIVGASEQLLHGVLFVFWQLKRQVDVMGYLVERSCLWRKPKEEEKEELARLRTGADGLEWFQDFYAAFLAILTQVYTLGIQWASTDGDIKATTNSALNAFASSGSADGGEPSISGAGRAIAQIGLSGVGGKDLLILSELIVSSAAVFSLLIAVRRRDDGPLTLGLSMLGWGSIFASRIIIIALSFVHIGWKIMLPLIFLHIFGITGWIYKIAIDSHNDKKHESEEYKWDLEMGGGGDEKEGEEDAEQAMTEIELGPDVSGRSSNKIDLEKEQLEEEIEQERPLVTNQWSCAEHVVLLAQVFTLFAIPSLFYWPIMFNLKTHARPFKYLVLIMSENFILIPAIWLTISSTATPGQWALLCAVGGFSIFGFVFVSLYICCKPDLTEYFARADELFNQAERCGIYFELCSRVFKMPDLSKHAFKRLMNQEESE